MRKPLICISERLTRTFVALVPVCLLISGCITENVQYEGVNDARGGGGTAVVKETPIDNNRRYETRLELAAVYYQGGQYDVAMQEVDKALEIRSRSAEATLLKGMIYERQGMSSNALDYIRRAMTYKPGDGDYMHNYGVALCANKSYAEGVKYLQQAVNAQGYQRVVNSLAAMGSCYAEQGDSQSAEAAFKKAQEIDPYNPYVLYHLASFMYNSGQLHAARQYFDKLSPLNNQNAPTLWLGIKIAYKQGDAMFGSQLARLLRDLYPSSAERNALERGDFDFK